MHVYLELRPITSQGSVYRIAALILYKTFVNRVFTEDIKAQGILKKTTHGIHSLSIKEMQTTLYKTKKDKKAEVIRRTRKHDRSHSSDFPVNFHEKFPILYSKCSEEK